MGSTGTSTRRAGGLTVAALAKAVALLLLGVWVLVFYGALLVAWQTDKLFWMPQIGFIDFVYFYAAALGVKQGGGATGIYDPERFYAYVARAISPRQPSGWYSFEYPPIVLPFLRPLAETSLPYAYAWWVLLGTIGLLAAVHAICRSYPPGSFSRGFLLLGTLASYPVWNTVASGQSSLFLAAASVFAWLALRGKQHLMAAAGSAASSFKCQFAPMLVIPGLALGRWRFAAGLAVTLTLLATTAITMIGPDCFAAFAGAVFSTESSAGNYTHLVPERMQTLRGQLVVLSGGATATDLTTASIAWLAAMAAVALLWMRVYPVLLERLPSGMPIFELSAAISCLALLIFSPHAYAYDYSILVIVCPFLWVWTEAGQQQFGSKLGTRALRWLIICFPALSWFYGFWAPALWRAGIELLFTWGAATLAAALYQLNLAWNLAPRARASQGGDSA